MVTDSAAEGNATELSAAVFRVTCGGQSGKGCDLGGHKNSIPNKIGAT
jgi:hypothetical protein